MTISQLTQRIQDSLSVIAYLREQGGNQFTSSTDTYQIGFICEALAQCGIQADEGYATCEDRNDYLLAIIVQGQVIGVGGELRWEDIHLAKDPNMKMRHDREYDVERLPPTPLSSWLDQCDVDEATALGARAARWLTARKLSRQTPDALTPRAKKVRL